MSNARIIRDLIEIGHRTSSLADRQKIDSAILALRLQDGQGDRQAPPARLNVELVALNLEMGLRRRYPDLPINFWTDLRKELALQAQERNNYA